MRSGRASAQVRFDERAAQVLDRVPAGGEQAEDGADERRPLKGDNARERAYTTASTSRR